MNIPVDRSLSTGLAREVVEPDVTSNRQPFNGRIFLLLLDDYQTDLSRTPFVRKAAREFVEKHVSATDLVAVVHTSGRRHGQDFTTSRTRLLAAIDSFSGTKLRSKAAALSDDREMTRNAMKTASNPMTSRCRLRGSSTTAAVTTSSATMRRLDARTGAFAASRSG